MSLLDSTLYKVNSNKGMMNSLKSSKTSSKVESTTSISIETFLKEFKSYLPIVDLSLSKELLLSCNEVLMNIDIKHIQLNSEQSITTAIKKKLKLEDSNLKSILDFSAKESLYFNSIEKKRILNLLCEGNWKSIFDILIKKGMSEQTINEKSTDVTPLTKSEVKELFCSQYNEPINRRTKLVDLDLRKPMIEAVFSSYFYESFDETAIHCFNSNIEIDNYLEDYWSYIHSDTGGLYHRDHALTYIDMGFATKESYSYEYIREVLISKVRDVYLNSDNHTYMFIRLPKELDCKWKLVSDCSLYAEKFDEKLEKIGYFNSQKILKETSSEGYSNFNLEDFSKLNEGFLYKDCFCLYEDEGNEEPSLLLVFRKDIRDKSKIPCPSCRSYNVQGNSYPSLGVKSWECKNLLCSDRSMSNRGKRYSFESLLRQRSIECPDSQISKTIISRWKRDIIYGVNESEIFEYIIKCYSLPLDGIHFYGSKPNNFYGRRVTLSKELLEGYVENSYWEAFESLDFFKRWHNVQCNNEEITATNLTSNKVVVFDVDILKGDCELSLKEIKDNSIGGAITSPPYYNAREYSQYPNIYVYLRKMEAIAKEVFRTLKPGAYFLFNIFDYFDNENIVASSAMGKKRLIISSYITYSFEKIGYKLKTNIPWDKGEIEGKRAYNSGNNTPFYQSPLNCWEHILVFQKTGGRDELEWEKVLKCKPVFKIIKGVNVYGHTAPFPADIPDLLSKKLVNKELILDPFAGSGTTALSAIKYSHKAVLCEADSDYIDLIEKRIYESMN